MATVCTTVQQHSASEGSVFPTGWSCCAKAAQNTHVHLCEDLPGRMCEPWTETTTRLEACSCTAHSFISSQLLFSPLQVARSHSFPAPCISSHPWDMHLLLSFPRDEGDFSTWTIARGECVETFSTCLLLCKMWKKVSLSSVALPEVFLKNTACLT